MEAPQNEQNNAFEPPVPLFVRQLRDAAGFISVRHLKMIVHILTVYLAFSALPNFLPESFTEVLCKLPVLSVYSPYCVREHCRSTGPDINLDCVAISRLQFQLGHVLEDSASITMMGKDIGCSAMTLRDSIIQIKLSSFEGKGVLGRALETSVQDGKVVSESLARFESRIWGVIADSVSLDDHVLLVLENMPLQSRWGFGDILGFLLSFGRVTPTSRQKTVEDVWLQAISLLEKNLRLLTHVTEANVHLLRRLEERLYDIQRIVTMEEQHGNDEQTFKRQRFSDEKKRDSHDTTFQILQTVLNVRKRALEALLKLQQVSNNLGCIREEAATPTRTACSMRVCIETLRSTIERLVKWQIQTREAEDTYRWTTPCSDYSI